MDVYEWQISFNGTTTWRPLKTFSWPAAVSNVGRQGPPRLPMFAGRFGTAPGGGILMVNPIGIGRFHAPLEARVGAAPDWSSTFNY